ncbi:hypothetical protein A3N95_20895 [Mycobacteroides abscessus]|nr:hypothetical protein A3N95_20895 [Mycobacteroides abscessus]
MLMGIDNKRNQAVPQRIPSLVHWPMADLVEPSSQTVASTYALNHPIAFEYLQYAIRGGLIHVCASCEFAHPHSAAAFIPKSGEQVHRFVYCSIRAADVIFWQERCLMSGRDGTGRHGHLKSRYFCHPDPRLIVSQE